jgi:TatD DNase family protein
MHDLVDSHVHLDQLAFAPDREAVIKRASLAGVSRMIIPATHAATWAALDALCGEHPHIYPAFGLHPVFIDKHLPEHVQTLSSWLDRNVAVAVGEIGLDFHVERLNRDLQRDYFTRQLQLASDYDLPVIVHARAALEEVILTLRRHGGLRGVVHSFSGSQQQAENLWKLGFHLGISGPITYERAQRLRRIVSNMPIQYLLLESDAPDQPDAGHRGQRNEPARVATILSCVAALREQPLAEVAAATTANARQLFKLD